jgi:hypothetical protein
MAFFYGNTIVAFVMLGVQSYPMVDLHLKAKANVELWRSMMTSTEYLKLLARRHRVVRIRPMGLHSVTFYTFSDYVVFVLSILLMILKT